MQQGGGVGYDFSLLRPRGFPVLHTGSVASGPVSFMRIWNAMCSTMQSSGSRRGAMMGLLRCDHPDIEEFIAAKKDSHELRHFNISVLVSDAFMHAVMENQEWALVFPSKQNSRKEMIHRHWSQSREAVPCEVIRRVSARELWSSIIRSAYDYAEPGVIFEDTINIQNNLWYREWISATNPCGEIPLPAFGACNLGALNLTQFVNHPFTDSAEIDWKKLENATIIATRFLDNVINVSRYPLRMQKQEEFATRRIGLGITGLGSAFVMMGIHYGSEQSVDLAKQLMKCISLTTWQTSIELARERGSFPVFHPEKYLQGHFVKGLPREIQQGIEKDGIRNSHHNTIAPSGTISLLANNISNGIEPIFSQQYERTIRGITGELKKFVVTDQVLQQWKKLGRDEARPPGWQDSHTLKPEDHLKMQSAMQPFIDHAISKTINIPEDFPFEKLKDVYTAAYQQGLKGCTIFRPNSITGSVLKLADYDDDVDHCCVS